MKKINVILCFILSTSMLLASDSTFAVSPEQCYAIESANCASRTGKTKRVCILRAVKQCGYSSKQQSSNNIPKNAPLARHKKMGKASPTSPSVDGFAPKKPGAAKFECTESTSGIGTNCTCTAWDCEEMLEQWTCTGATISSGGSHTHQGCTKND